MSWPISNRLDAAFCVSALREGMIKYGTPEIFDTGHGCQITGEDFMHMFKDRGVRISMDSKGRWTDNVFIEWLWHSLKYEEVYLKAYDTIPKARETIDH